MVKTFVLLCFAGGVFAQPSLPRRPQNPGPVVPYSVENVRYDSGPNHFDGVLFLPKGKAPFPSVLLIGDSGWQDRDETIAGHKPFLVLADYLTRRGLAVLRVDKLKSSRTIEEQADDALVGVAFLKARREVDAKNTGLIGHGEGGNVAALAGSRSKEVAFVVMLAAPAVAGAKEMILQTELALRTAGAPTEAIDLRVSVLRQMLAVVRDEKDPAAAEPKLRAIWQRAQSSLPDAILNQIPWSETEIQKLNSAETRWSLLHDPSDTLRKLQIPALALYPSRDLETPPKENVDAVSAALKSAGNREYRVEQVAGLNHLFQKCDLCTAAEYGKIEETFSPGAMELIADWILSHKEPPR